MLLEILKKSVKVFRQACRKLLVRTVTLYIMVKCIVFMFILENTYKAFGRLSIFKLCQDDHFSVRQCVQWRGDDNKAFYKKTFSLIFTKKVRCLERNAIMTPNVFGSVMSFVMDKVELPANQTV